MSYIKGDLRVTGTITAQRIVPTDGSVTDDTVLAGAAIDATKLEHEHVITKALAPHATAAAATRQVIHVVAGNTGDIVSFSVGATVAPTGGDSVTVNLRNNGTEILSAAVVLDNTNTNFVLEEGTLSDAALTVGDVIEAEISAVSGTTGKGVFVQLVTRELSAA